jgi:hypothetical protein
VGVKDIYSALYGVVGNKIDPTKAIFPASGPSTAIPKIDAKNAKLPDTAVKK